ncbi:MAG: OPT/YSL family transporter [Planctomycetes bacterium]|nr:OPT/YSL family transporter [Planctomycetota bacterium]MBL7008771.1 OPT/YSL family transporter [Planctomycetota bacterium]
MALIQRAASTPEEVELSKPLDIPPEVVAEMDEEEWYAKAYRGEDVPQLTWRALLMGSVLGFFLAFTNLYIGLKTGWHLGVAITACILSYSVWNFFLGIGIARTPMSILENNCMQSTASAAGYSTGGTMVSAIPALLMLSVTAASPGGVHLSWPVLAAWTFFLAMLGVVLAIPMKRNMINQEKLKFPSGTAAAVTLQGLYSHGNTAARKAKALFGAGVIGLVTPLLIALQAFKDKAGEAAALLPDKSKLFDFLPGVTAKVDGLSTYLKPSDLTIKMDHSLVMVAAGALVGLRVAVSMVIAGLLLAYWVTPEALDAGAATSGAKAWKEIGVWIGAPIMVASGILSFAFQWKTIGRAFTGFGRSGDPDDIASRVEVPGSWFLLGTLVAGGAVVYIAWRFFEVPPHWGAVAVILTFILALVACRATGESDITPTGAMGKIMQLTYGLAIPQNATANLMTAGITAGAASASADLLNDLKSGYLLGANPRRQFLAQFLGIFTGTVATVIGFYFLVPDVQALEEDFPAPAAQAWRAVAEVFRDGFENLHPMARAGVQWGLLVGAVLVIAEKVFPTVKKWLPSATGIGLGFILPFNYPLSMFLGALAAWLWTRSNKERADEFTVPIASGIIAGESIMGVGVAIVNTVAF